MRRDKAKASAPQAVVAKDSWNVRRKSAGKWRRRAPVLEALESRRLLSVNIAEFPIPGLGGNPQGVASGAGTDKNIWFTLNSNNIGMINPSNTGAGVTQYPIPTDNSGAGPIAAGPDGNYWFFEETPISSESSTRRPATSPRSRCSAPRNPRVDGITAGPNGTVWFTESSTNQIGDDQHGHRPDLAVSRRSPSAAEPYGIVEGPDGNMWFTEAGTNKIGMINPTTHAMKEFPIDASGYDEAEGITVGPDGNLWFTLTGTDKIAVMSPSTGASPSRIRGHDRGCRAQFHHARSG